MAELEVRVVNGNASGTAIDAVNVEDLDRGFAPATGVGRP
jgi:hypothetical protein